MIVIALQHTGCVLVSILFGTSILMFYTCYLQTPFPALEPHPLVFGIYRSHEK